MCFFFEIIHSCLNKIAKETIIALINHTKIELMDASELKRRDFLKKLGLITGAAALSGVGGVAELLIDNKK